MINFINAMLLVGGLLMVVWMLPWPIALAITALVGWWLWKCN